MRWHGCEVSAAGRLPTLTILSTTSFMKGACGFTWTPLYWHVLFKLMRSIAAPGHLRHHGKISLFRSRSTSPSLDSLGVACGIGDCGSQRSGLAWLVGLVHGKRVALCATV